MTEQLSIFGNETSKGRRPQVVNVASVPQRSPFRYPGGKTWLVPTIRKWLQQERRVKELIEPFAGGGIVSLTAAFEQLADHITMVELDEEVAAVWEVIFSDKNEWLADKIFKFELTLDHVKAELDRKDKAVQEVALCTILKNRICHGGILAKGSGLIKQGEKGKGITSRWYAKTLRDRILATHLVKDKITFYRGDAFEVLEQHKNRPECYFFLDPPYTVAGKRLYTHFDIDHEQLLSLSTQIQGKFLLTYDDTSEVRSLANKYQLKYRTIPMKTTHHLEKSEIIISDNFDW